MSSRQTWAPDAWAAAVTSSPRPTWATTSMSGSSDRSAAIAPRTSAWSSASSTWITGAPGAPCRSPGPVRSRTSPPTPITRSRKPRRPMPSGRPTAPLPSSVTVRRFSPSSTRQHVAPLWRTTFVTASRTAQASTIRCRGSTTADSSSSGRRATRSPATVARMSARDCRVSDWISASSALARSGSASTSQWQPSRSRSRRRWPRRLHRPRTSLPARPVRPRGRRASAGAVGSEIHCSTSLH